MRETKPTKAFRLTKDDEQIVRSRITKDRNLNYWIAGTAAVLGVAGLAALHGAGALGWVDVNGFLPDIATTVHHVTSNIPGLTGLTGLAHGVTPDKFLDTDIAFQNGAFPTLEGAAGVVGLYGLARAKQDQDRLDNKDYQDFSKDRNILNGLLLAASAGVVIAGVFMLHQTPDYHAMASLSNVNPNGIWTLFPINGNTIDGIAHAAQNTGIGRALIGTGLGVAGFNLFANTEKSPYHASNKKVATILAGESLNLPTKH